MADRAADPDPEATQEFPVQPWPLDPADPVADEPSDGKRPFLAYSIVVFVLAVGAAALVARLLPAARMDHPVLTGLALTAGFLLAEQLAINVDVRSGVSWTISFTEIPLVIGLFVAPFEVVLAAHLIAGVGTLVIRGVRDRLLYNAGAILEISRAFAVAGLVRHGRRQRAARPWLAVLAGALTAPLVSTLLALAAVRVLGSRMRVGAAVRLTVRILVRRLGQHVRRRGRLPRRHAGAGRLAARHRGARRLTALYWAYSGLLREQRDLEALSELSLTVARSGQQAAAAAGQPG